MRLESVTIRNLGPFRDFTVDFAALARAKLVAIVGPNGAGKSTLLELGLPGALYRTTPTRGSLTSLATARDAMLEARVVNGQSWTIRHLVDAVSGKGESVVLGDDGQPAFDSSKVRDFDTWAAKNLTPPEVLFCSVFTPQGAAGFLGMKPAERKSVLLRVLGIERLEHLAATARERAGSERHRMEILEARLADVRDRFDADASDAKVAVCREYVVDCEANLVATRQALEGAEREARRIEELRAEMVRRDARRSELGAAILLAHDRIRDLQQRVANNRAVMADRGEIEDAIAELPKARDWVATAERTLGDVRAEIEAGAAECRRHLADREAAQQRNLAAQTRAQTARQRLGQREAVEQASRKLADWRREVDARQALCTEIESALRQLSRQRIAGAEERIDALRGGLNRIGDACPGVEDLGGIAELAQIADETLDHDNAAIRAACETPAAIEATERELAKARQNLTKHQEYLARAEQLAALKPTIDAAARDVEAAETDATRESAAAEAALEAFIAAEQRSQTGKLGSAEQELTMARAQLTRVEELAARKPRLDAAAGRLAELELQVTATEQEIARLTAERDAAPTPEPVPDPPNVDVLRTAFASHETAVRDARAELTRAEQLLEQSKASAARIAELEAQRAAVEAELADWNRLAQDLGRDGLQALEIDAAGPELTALVNDLLEHCHGPRFRVRVDTQRLAADGKRLLEGCDVVVLDSERGREAPGETFSGGERVIISEALSLALSMLACRRAGLSDVTLVRDESGAALDPTNGRAWIAMLRRAVDVVGARQCLFVAHNPELVELADARVEVG